MLHTHFKCLSLSFKSAVMHNRTLPELVKLLWYY